MICMYPVVEGLQLMLKKLVTILAINMFKLGGYLMLLKKFFLLFDLDSHCKILLPPS